MNLYTYVGNNPLTNIDPSGHLSMPITGLNAGALIDIARKSGGSASQTYWDIKSDMGEIREDFLSMDRNQFLYLFNLATRTVCDAQGSCRNATADDKGYSEDEAAWAKRELMIANEVAYIRHEEAVQDLVIGFAGRVSSWIRRATYKEIAKELGKEAQKKFASSMAKGFVNSAKGANGIKGLKGNGITVGNTTYMYEVKLMGDYGGWRVLGNFDEKTGHYIFEVLQKTHK